jgi:hypothetical protein
MRRLFVLGVILLLAGCGGGGEDFFGSVSGVVFDAQGNIVRGASVFCGNRSTSSSSSGSFVLENVPEGIQVIQSEITQDGVHYIGQNLANVQRDQRMASVNISLYHDTNVGDVHGSVQDRAGFSVQGAKVLALAPNSNTSAIAFTDQFGNYQLSKLEAGVSYSIQATGRTFDSDATTVSLTAGQEKGINFTLNQESNPTFAAPTGLAAVTWTAPGVATRSIGQASAYEAIKRLYDRKRPNTTTRLTSLGNPIEVDLTWNPISDPSLLGYGVYRSLGINGVDTSVSFYRDPLAGYFADSDPSLQPNTTYGYDITALNTSYPDTSNSESAKSTKVGAFTLDDMVLNNVTFAPITFNWQPVANADDYVVYVFSEFPGLGITPVWSNEGSPATGTSLAYGGPAITGHTYYYVVLGLGNSNASRTISPIDSFTP